MATTAPPRELTLDRVRELFAARAFDRLDLDEVRALYAANPINAELAQITGVLTQREIARARAPHEAQEKEERAAAREEARRQDKADAPFFQMDSGAFQDFIIEVHDDRCPGGGTDNPHTIRGFLVRQGTSWRCRRCDHVEDALPHWRERHGDD